MICTLSGKDSAEHRHEGHCRDRGGTRVTHKLDIKQCGGCKGRQLGLNQILPLPRAQTGDTRWMPVSTS